MKIKKKSILTLKPDLLVLIDYQEFKMKIAKFAKSKGIKVLFYISPQVWAWRENRIKKIKNYIDEMAVIFPFETKYYKKFGVNLPDGYTPPEDETTYDPFLPLEGGQDNLFSIGSGLEKYLSQYN